MIYNVVKMNKEFKKENEKGKLLIIRNKLYYRAKGIYLCEIDRKTLQRIDIDDSEFDLKGERVLWKE